jgi:hypothetical protein
MKAFKKLLLLIAVTTLVGCAGSSQHMRELTPAEANYAPDADHALVVFMRPSSYGFAIQSSVFDTTEEETKFIGIVSAQKKVAYMSPPGERNFMVIGESADFARANLLAGKTYYMVVTPRMGFWKARFSLDPVTAEELESKKADSWIDGCTYTENTPSAYQWAKENSESIEDKRREYFKDWMEKAEEKRPYLRAEDCR